MDVGEAGRGTNAEAGFLEDEAAGVDELVVAPKDKHGSWSWHRRHPACWIAARGYTVDLCDPPVCPLPNTSVFSIEPTQYPIYKSMVTTPDEKLSTVSIPERESR
jgi:hypothetical protein